MLSCESRARGAEFPLLPQLLPDGRSGPRSSGPPSGPRTSSRSRSTPGRLSVRLAVRPRRVTLGELGAAQQPAVSPGTVGLRLAASSGPPVSGIRRASRSTGTLSPAPRRCLAQAGGWAPRRPSPCHDGARATRGEVLTRIPSASARSLSARPVFFAEPPPAEASRSSAGTVGLAERLVQAAERRETYR
jgi:hypothetical protein